MIWAGLICQKREKWRAVVKEVMNPCVLQNAGLYIDWLRNYQILPSDFDFKFCCLNFAKLPTCTADVPDNVKTICAAVTFLLTPHGVNLCQNRLATEHRNFEST